MRHVEKCRHDPCDDPGNGSIVHGQQGGEVASTAARMVTSYITIEKNDRQPVQFENLDKLLRHYGMAGYTSHSCLLKLNLWLGRTQLIPTLCSHGVVNRL